MTDQANNDVVPLDLLVVSTSWLYRHFDSADDPVPVFKRWLKRVAAGARNKELPACMCCHRVFRHTGQFSAVCIVRSATMESVAALCRECTAGGASDVLDRVRPILAAKFHAEIHMVN